MRKQTKKVKRKIMKMNKINKKNNFIIPNLFLISFGVLSMIGGLLLLIIGSMLHQFFVSIIAAGIWFLIGVEFLKLADKMFIRGQNGRK